MNDQAVRGGRTAAAPVSYARPPEIEEPLNSRFVHPMSRALARALQPTGISPNAVSVLGVVMMSCACACYALLAWPWGPLAGLVFHIGWHVFDGADGELARRTGRSSPIGEIVDGVCDHLSHGVLYATLGLMLARTLGGWAWALTIPSAASRALQAICYETARRNYRRWVYGVNWIRQDIAKANAQAQGGLAPRIGVFLAGVYLRLSVFVRADDAAIDAEMGRILAERPAQASEARALYQAEERRLVKRASWLSTNYETLGVFVTVLAGSPLYFLAFQLVALNLIMAWVVSGQRRSYARLVPRLRTLNG